jgi:hypothetical protein
VGGGGAGRRCAGQAYICGRRVGGTSFRRVCVFISAGRRVRAALYDGVLHDGVLHNGVLKNGVRTRRVCART